MTTIRPIKVIKRLAVCRMTEAEFETYGRYLQEEQHRGLRPTEYGLHTYTMRAAKASDELARIAYGRGYQWNIEQAKEKNK